MERFNQVARQLNHINLGLSRNSDLEPAKLNSDWPVSLQAQLPPARPPASLIGLQIGARSPANLRPPNNMQIRANNCEPARVSLRAQARVH